MLSVTAMMPLFAVMQHIEYAGIHSGDSASVIPRVQITEEQVKTIEEYTRRIAIEMKVVD